MVVDVQLPEAHIASGILCPEPAHLLTTGTGQGVSPGKQHASRYTAHELAAWPHVVAFHPRSRNAVHTALFGHGRRLYDHTHDESS